MKNWRLRLISLLSLIGLATAGYLVYFHGLVSHDPSVPCIGGSGCATLSASTYASVFGIPIAWLGVLGFIAIFIASLMRWRKLIFLMSIPAMVIVAYLVYIELWVFGEICNLCTITHIVGALILALSYRKKYINELKIELV